MKTRNLNQNSKRMMKSFSLFTLLFSFAFASCSKSEEAPTLPQSGEQFSTFSIATPATRGDVSGLSRYIVEAYEDNDFETEPLRVEAATGSLTLELKKYTDYTFVFWADKGTAKMESVASSGYYNTDKLQEVVVSAGKESTTGEMAYCLAVSFNSKDFDTNKNITLKNATAQINFVEAIGLLTTNNTLTVKYPSGGKLNVATGEITEIESEISRTYTNIGAIAQDGTLTTDYILAPLKDKRLLDLTVTLNAEPEKIIVAVPFQQSYKTNVKGEFSNFYSSLFTISNEVEDYGQNPDIEFPKKLRVGNFYYSDKTFSSTIEDTKTCIGIVFWVDPMNANKGQIVSLDEGTSKEWGSAQNWTSNTTLPNGMTWIAPTLEELRALYVAWNGGTGVANTVARTAFNTQLATASGTEIGNNGTYYWSSTKTVNGAAAWHVNVTDGTEANSRMNTPRNIRLVCAFLSGE